MPFAIQLQRFARALAKRFGIQGYVPLQLIDDVFPVVQVRSPDDPVDAFLREELRYWGHQLAGPVAAQVSSCMLELPSTASGLVVVEFMRIQTGAATDPVRIGVVPELGIAATPHNMMDSRIPVTIPPSLTKSKANLGGLSQAGNILTTAHPTHNGGDKLDFRVVLSPGFRLLVENTAVNSSIELTLWWREVPAAPQELSLG